MPDRNPNPGVAASPGDSTVPPPLSDAQYRQRMSAAVAALRAAPKGVPQGALLFVHYALDGGLCLDAVTLPEIARAAGVSERTALTIRAWVAAHNLLADIEIEYPRKILRYGCNTSTSEQSFSENITHPHAAKSCGDDPAPDPQRSLALEKLEGLGFGTFAGIPMPRRKPRLEAFVDRWGPQAVLYAVWCVEAPAKAAVRNKAALVRSKVESGQQAPPGWAYVAAVDPEEARQEAARAAVAAEAARRAERTAVVLPPTQPGLEAVFDALRGNLPAAAFEYYLRPATLTREGAQLILWCPDEAGARWCAAYFGDRVRAAAAEALGTGFEVAIRGPEINKVVNTERRG